MELKPLIVIGEIVSKDGDKIILEVIYGPKDRRRIVGKGKAAKNFKIGDKIKFWNDK